MTVAAAVRRPVRSSYLTLVGVCAFWGTIPFLSAAVDLPAAAIVFVRVWVAALGLAAAVATRRPGTGGPALLSRRPGLSIVVGVLLAVHWTAMFAGYQRAPDDTVVFIIFLAPVGIALLAPRTLGERLGLRTIAALALAVGGFALVALPSVEAAALAGIAWAVLSGVTLVALVLVSKPLAEEYGGLRLTLLEMTIAGVALLPVALTLDWGPPQPAWGWLVVLGLVHTAVGVALYLSALARVPATHVGILGYLEPVVVVLLSWVLLAQRPALTTLAGGAAIVGAGAVLLLTRDDPEVPADVPG